MRDDVQGAVFALGTRSIQCGLLLFGEQGVAVRSGGAEMKPAEVQALTAVAVGEQSEVADLDEGGREHM